MIFVSRKTKILVFLGSVILIIAGCGGQKSDQNHSMLAAQSDAIVANEVQATMAKQLKNITVVKIVPAPASSVTPTIPVVQNTAPAS